MKKLLKTLTTVLALALCFAVPAFAATINADTPSVSVDVEGIYNAGSAADELISVDVEWNSMSFTYNDTIEGVWNNTTHAYDGAVAAKWTCEENENEIVVTNHSNTAVEAQLTFAKADGTDIVGEFEENYGTANDGIMPIATAVDTAVDEAPYAVAYFNVVGGAIVEDGILGTITVTIVKA